MQTIFKFIFLVIMCGIFAPQFFGQTNNLTAVYDGRTGLKLARISAENQKLIETEVRKKEKFLKEKINVVCDEEEFSVFDAAAGAFTRAGSSQKAFMYELCRSGRSFGIGGIVIVEDGKIVSHYAYGENGLYIGLIAVPDINQNGIQEILLIGSGSGQGYTSSAIETYEILNGKLNFLGRASVYDDNYGTGKRVLEATAYKIFAQKATAPIFTREAYIQKGENAKWVLTRKAQRFSLSKTDPPKIYKVM